MFEYEFREEKLTGKSVEEVLLLIDNLFKERHEFNKNKGTFDKQITDQDTSIKKYFEYFNACKQAVMEKEDFSTGFEKAILLKLHMNTYSSAFSLLVGDQEIGNLFGFLTRKITSKFFNVLEKMEEHLKVNGEFKKLIDNEFVEKEIKLIS
jgi:hypothetical protein